MRQGAHHPLVTVHPETGVKNIYANRGLTISVDGVSSEESEEILEYLFAHVEQPQFVYPHYYKHGDLVMWDNRAI